MYEERVILIRASTVEDAMRKGETEAKGYAREGIEYLGFMDLYHLATDGVGDLSEVYSLMRSSNLSPTEYLDHFYDTGTEHSGAKGESAT